MKPSVELVGTDGNVFAIIGKVLSALNRTGLKKEATEFVNKATNSSSYDEVLQLCMEYVEVY